MHIGCTSSALFKCTLDALLKLKCQWDTHGVLRSVHNIRLGERCNVATRRMQATVHSLERILWTGLYYTRLRMTPLRVSAVAMETFDLYLCGWLLIECACALDSTFKLGISSMSALYRLVGSKEEPSCSQYYTTSDQLLHVPHNNWWTELCMCVLTNRFEICCHCSVIVPSWHIKRSFILLYIVLKRG